MSSPKSGANPYTAGMARFVSGLRYEAIPADVVERIKLLILDSLGCAIYGTDLESSQILLNTLKAVDTTPGNAIWGTRERLSAPHAALAKAFPSEGITE